MVAMSRKIPVALFAYNRPDHTRRCLEALSKCRRIDECDIYLYSDGPRSADDVQRVDETRRMLHYWSHKLNALVVERAENDGLAKSIVGGVSDLCARYGRVIVIEDDLIVSPDFIHFMIESLELYEHEERVLQVGGYTIRTPNQIATDAFFLPISTTWGWATWDRAWKYFSWEPERFAESEKDVEWLRLFNLNGSYPYSSMLSERLAGRNDSWGILWWYAVSRQRGLVVYPVNSMVWNGGFDNSGTHCGSDNVVGQNTDLSYLQTKLPETISFPTSIEWDEAHLSCLEEFIRGNILKNQ